jgi:hypothetical protein
MGCGCKNNNSQNSTPQQQKVQVQPPQQKTSVNEDIRTAIKKTVEKYYNVNKSTK